MGGAWVPYCKTQPQSPQKSGASEDALAGIELRADGEAEKNIGSDCSVEKGRCSLNSYRLSFIIVA